MPSSSVSWGIEVGASAIKAVKLEAVGDEGARVLEFAVIQHPKPLSTPGVDANDVLRVSLGAFTSQYDLGKASVAVSVPGHAGFARFAKLPPVEPKKVPDIVKFEAMQQIPFPLEQVEWDYQTFVTPDSPEVEVGIFAITRERVQERLAMLADFGIHPDYVTLSPLAVYNALAFDLQFGADTPGTIIVDVGTTSTDLVVATPGRMWVRTFPIGGHQFTEALVSQFQLSYPKAEKLKREAEDSKHARQVFQAMRPVFTDLAQDIQRSIGYYQSLNKDANLTRLIGVGSTFGLPGLRKYLKQQLSMDVYRIEEFKNVKLEGAKDGDDRSKAFHDSSLVLCTAYGLALQGLGLNAVGGNLMPVATLRKAMWREKVPWFGMAAGVAALAGGAMFIGPLRDYFDINGHTPDPVINSAVRKSTELIGAATEAGVTSAGEPQLAAANMVALGDHRGIYTRIAGDVSEMVGAAVDRAASWAEEQKVPPSPPGSAVIIENFKTEYLAPSPADDGTGYSPRAMADDGSSALKISEHPRIRCELTIRTNQARPERFIPETIGKWLASNATRDGVPYVLKYSEPAFTLLKSKTAGAAPTMPGETGEGPRSGRLGAGGGQAPRIVRRDGLQPDEILPPAQATPGVRATGEGGQPRDLQAEVDRAKAQEELERLAPVVAPADAAPAETGVVTVTWWATIVPPAGAGEAGGGR